MCISYYLAGTGLLGTAHLATVATARESQSEVHIPLEVTLHGRTEVKAGHSEMMCRKGSGGLSLRCVLVSPSGCSIGRQAQY